MNKKLMEIRARHYPDALGFPAALKEAYLAGIEHGLEHLIDSGFIGSRYAVDARAAIRALVTAERDIPLSQQAPR